MLIRDLLHASRIDAHRVALDRRPLSLLETASALLAEIKQALGMHPVSLEVLSEPPLVSADPLRVEQILTNLLENAAKHSADGTPIRIVLAAEAGGAALSFEDRGPGIAPEEIPHPFDRGYQTRRARAAKRGLGLYITRGLVEAHGGKITVDSSVGHVSTFHVWLPAVQA